MVDNFNDEVFVENFIKKLFLGKKPMSLHQIHNLATEAIPPHLEVKFITGVPKVQGNDPESIELAMDTKHLNESLSIEITVQDLDGWVESNRFYNPKNSIEEMERLHLSSLEENQEERFNTIHHQLRR